MSAHAAVSTQDCGWLMSGGEPEASDGRSPGLQTAESKGFNWPHLSLTTSRMPDDAPLPRLAESRLIEALADTPVVLVHGPRQRGKTTLSMEVGKRLGFTLPDLGR